MIQFMEKDIWEWKPLKYIFNYSLSSVDRKIKDEELSVHICHYPDVYKNEKISNKNNLNRGTCTELELENFKLKKGDILITKDSEDPTDIGIPCLIENNLNDAVCGYHIGILRTNENLEREFYFRYIQSTDVKDFFFCESNGITRFGLGKSSVENLKIPILSIKEQKIISQYLDQKTKKIDSLVEKIEKKINLLKEQKISLINQYVTKGLDPNVEMKDSQVDWIGEVPKEWKIMKIKHLASVKRGSSPRPIDDPKYFDEDGEFSWVRISDVSSSGKYLLKTTQKLSSLGSSLSTPMEIGDLFLSIAGSVGKPIITNIKCCIHDGFVWFDEISVNKDYLFYIFLCGSCFKGLGKMGTQLNLNTETVGQIKIPFPKLELQKYIVERLELKIKLFDRCIESLSTRINLLAEYRQSLISFAVTGKIQITEDMI